MSLLAWLTVAVLLVVASAGRPRMDSFVLWGLALLAGSVGATAWVLG